MNKKQIQEELDSATPPFEVIQSDGSVLRFEGQQFSYELDGNNIKILNTHNDELYTVTIILGALRVDSVDINTCLSMPPRKLQQYRYCERCGHLHNEK